MKVTPTTIEIREKHAEWLELRRRGWSYQRIADRFGCARSSVWEAVRARLAEVTAEPAAAIITLEVERLDELWRITFRKARKGDLGAVAACLRIMERRAALLKLDGVQAPETDEITEAEFRQFAAMLGYDLVARESDARESDGTT